MELPQVMSSTNSDKSTMDNFQVEKLPKKCFLVHHWIPTKNRTTQ